MRMYTCMYVCSGTLLQTGYIYYSTAKLSHHKQNTLNL